MNCIDNSKKQLSVIKAEQIILNECTTFVKKIMGDIESPWNQDIISFAYKNNIAYLSKYQKFLLKILQKCFQRDMPFFVQQKFIAKQLGCDRTRVTKIVSALVNKNLILKINWFYKEQYRVLLLPNTPEISKIIQLKQKTTIDKRQFNNWMKNNKSHYTACLDKIPTKSLKKQTYIILCTLNIYNNTKEINYSHKQNIYSLFSQERKKSQRYRLKTDNIKKNINTNKQMMHGYNKKMLSYGFCIAQESI